MAWNMPSTSSDALKSQYAMPTISAVWWHFLACQGNIASAAAVAVYSISNYEHKIARPQELK
jgi:hypothetical protein